MNVTVTLNGNKTILEEVRGLQDITSDIKETMGQMKDAAEKVYDTSNQLSEISVQVQMQPQEELLLQDLFYTHR